MESFSGDNEGSTEDITKHKSFKIKSIKTRFFRKSKKTGSEADAKLSQSASDINAGKGLGSDEDLASQSTMGSRAFSHDSIFLADEDLSDPDPVRVSSQENVHSKIKSLQMKLQLQKMHFGPPPMVLPIRSPEETAHQSEDFPFHGPNETSREETLTKTTSQPTSPPFSPISRLAQTRSQPQMPSFHFSLSGPNYSSPNTVEAPVDFSTPAEFTASLDTSAARHRLSIKPRNQRASTKKKPSSGTESGSPSHDLKIPDRFEFMREKEPEIVAQEREAGATEKDQVDISQLSPPKLEEASPVSSEVASKLPSQSFTQQGNAFTETEVLPMLRVKPLRPLDASSIKRPHSSYIEGEINVKKEADIESQVTSQNKRNTFVGSMSDVSPDQLSPFSSLLASRTSCAQQQKLQRDEDTSMKIKRPSSGYDSFHFSKNWDDERPRSGSFTGVLEKSKARTKSFEGTEEKIPSETVEDKSFTGFLEFPEAKTRSPGVTEEKITREKEELKDFPEVLEKTETKTKSFGEAKEKITTEKEELKGFPEVLQKTEAKTRSFGGTEEKISREKLKLKDFLEVQEKTEVRTGSSGGIEERISRERVEHKSFQGFLEFPEAKTRSSGGTEEKITREKEELKDFPEVLEKTETKTKSFGEAKQKITREKVELKGFPEVLQKTEAKTRLFGGTEEKITREKEELKDFPEVLEKTETKTKSFGEAKQKIPREKMELKGFPEVLEKAEIRTKLSGGIEERITRERMEQKSFQGFLESLDGNTRASGRTEEEITREKKELKGFPEVQEKTEIKTRLFGGTQDKITKEREEPKGFPDVLEKIETKTRSFGGTEEKITREKLERKGFTGFLESPEAKARSSGGPEERFTREKDEIKSLQPKGSHFAADRFKGSSFSWERNVSFKKSESVTTAKNAPTDTYIVEAVRVDGTKEVVEEAQEAKELPEDEMRTPFGIKLRTTSQSFKFRSETVSQRHSMTRLFNDQDDKKKIRLGDGSSQMSESTLAKMGSSFKSSDQAPLGVTLPVRRHASLEESPQTTPTEVQKTSSYPREAETIPRNTQATPQTSSSEASWMSLAMEKTRSLQQLLTGRFQRDFTGTQTAAQPKSLEETMTGSQIQVQTVKIQQSKTQPSSDIVKEESVQSGSQEQTVKPSTAATQKKTVQSSQIESYSPRHSKIFRQRSQSQTQPNRAQSDAQTIARTTHLPSPSSPLIGNTSPFTRGYAPQLVPQSHLSSVQQETPWTSRGFQPVTQFKHVPSGLESEPEVTSAAVPTLESALERREREVSFAKESPSLVSKRVLWTGSMADRAAFREKRAEWSTPPSLKEVEQRKAQTQMQISGDADTSVKLFPLSKETMEIKQVVKSAESSPSRVLEKLREDKWTQRNVELPSSPSSLRTHSSVLQSDSNQPSWMELAKRKSMAWSDKSMD